MQVSKDYEDLFSALNASKIRYLVVGAYAVMHYTEPRFTKDIDVWIIPEMNDAEKVYDALKKFGAPLKGIGADDFRDKTMILQIGIAPVRIDIMIDVPGLDFETAWRRRKRGAYGRAPINLLGREDVIKAKRHAGRPQDKLDLEKLKGRIRVNKGR